MSRYIYRATILLAFFLVSCDNANDLLDQYIKDGPIVYAGKINDSNTQSGYYRLRVNIYPAEDVNRSHCMLKWNVTSGVRDSVRMDYVDANYDKDLKCYYTILNLPSIEGNLLIESQNVDVFGNRSLIDNKGAFIYGSTYVSTLLNSLVSFTPNATEVIFENRVGSVGNLLSYEQNNGQFTKEVFVTNRYPLTDAKKGGIIRSKTRYLLTETDIDTLVTTEYLETSIPK